MALLSLTTTHKSISEARKQAVENRSLHLNHGSSKRWLKIAQTVHNECLEKTKGKTAKTTRATDIERESSRENETKRQHVALHKNPNHQSCFIMSQNRVRNVYNYNQVWQAHTQASFRGVLFSSLQFFCCSLIYHYSSPRIYWTDINLISFYEYVHNIPTKCLLKLRGLSQISCGEQIESTESVLELEQFEDCIIHL